MIALAAAACGADEGEEMRAGVVTEEAVDVDALTRACAGGGTLRGIDISYYQGTINWDQVKGAGIEYAFIRVSDGTAHPDSQFARNWSEARRAGVRRGVYQFFRPNVDPIAQADLLLSRMGELLPGDLPPVIDIEASGGLSASSVAAKARQWIDHVEARLGVTPIIYTGPYFWRDSVGSPAFSTNHPLWVAHYTTACPLVPEPWTRWTFHQFTDSGRVAGISGNVDTNYFNGTAADLAALGFRAPTEPDPMEPDPTDPTDPNSCQNVGTSGRTLEEDDNCVQLGGPAQYLRSESGGSDGSHVWTGVTNSAQAVNFARYDFKFDRSGLYRVEAFAQGATANTRQAGYKVVHSGGTDTVFVNQTTSRGFVELGAFNFNAGTTYSLRLDDNTGEASSLDRRAIFDAVRLTAITELPCRTLGLSAGTTGLNVRSRPSTSGTVLTALSTGQRAERLATVSGDLVSTTSDWHRVRTGQTVGYVSGRYTTCVQ